jgi:hypothetical protein
MRIWEPRSGFFVCKSDLIRIDTEINTSSLFPIMSMSGYIGNGRANLDRVISALNWRLMSNDSEKPELRKSSIVEHAMKKYQGKLYQTRKHSIWKNRWIHWGKRSWIEVFLRKFPRSESSRHIPKKKWIVVGWFSMGIHLRQDKNISCYVNQNFLAACILKISKPHFHYHRVYSRPDIERCWRMAVLVTPATKKLSVEIINIHIQPLLRCMDLVPEFKLVQNQARI